MSTKVMNGLDLQSQKIVAVQDPTNPQEAATKNYVDNKISGLDWHAHVRVNAAANVTISAPGTTVDGITMVAGDRVLLTNQATGLQNGLWVWNSSGGAMTRPTDYAAAAVLAKPSVTVFVTEGALADKAYSLTTDGTVTVDTTTTAWVLVGGGTSYTAGNGLTGSTTFSVLAQDTSIDVSSSGIRVGSGALLTNGGLQGGSGTGVSVKNTTGITVGASGVGVDYSVTAQKKAFAIGDGSTLTYTVTHNIGSRDVVVSVYDAVSFNVVMADVANASTNTVTVTFAVAPSTNAYRVVVVG